MSGMTPEIRERLRGFVDFASIHLERGNLDAVREALEDALRLLTSARHDDEEGWL